MHPSEAVQALLDVTEALQHSNRHAGLVAQARAMAQQVAANELRCRELERLGLASWHEGWALRSQAHSALMRALPLLREKARTAEAEANRYYQRHIAPTPLGDTAANASIRRERRAAHTAGMMYRSGD